DLTQLAAALDTLRLEHAPRRRRQWAYYNNPLRPVSPADAAADRPYRMAQEWGLPGRITGSLAGAEPSLYAPVDGVQRKQVVIENDIGWRIDAMVDRLFGTPLAITAEREDITQLLQAVFHHNGGVTFLQQLALLGAVHGFADVIV